MRKEIYEKSPGNIMLRTRQGCLLSLLHFKTVPEILARAIRQEKEKKNHSYWKGRSKTKFVENTAFSPSIQFSHSVISDSLWPHESQHVRPPCPSPTPGVYSNSYSSSQWCHPAISSSVIPFSSFPQSLPASRFFQWVNSLHEVARVLELQPQHHLFQWTPRTDLL